MPILHIGRLGRKKLSVLLRILGVGQGVGGAAMFLISSSQLHELNDKLPIQELHLTVLLTVLLLSGALIIFLAATGERVRNISYNYPTKASSVRWQVIWTILTIVLVSTVMITAIILPEITELSYNELADFLYSGIEKYHVEEGWKSAFDKMHYRLHCCGAYSHEDWFHRNWIPLESFSERVITNLVRSDGRVYYEIVPASCCSPFSTYTCFHDTVQQNETRDKSTPQLEGIYTQGCLGALTRNFTEHFRAMRLLCIFQCIFQIGQLIIGRSLFTTSIHTAWREALHRAWARRHNLRANFLRHNRRRKLKMIQLKEPLQETPL